MPSTKRFSEPMTTIRARIILKLALASAALVGQSTSRADCNFYGQTVKEGQTVQAFKSAFVPSGKSCEAQTRTCRGGKMAGGYFHPSCSPVRSVKPTDTQPFLRSDVMLTVRLPKHYYLKPWFDVYNEYQANRIVWTYAGNELLQDARVSRKIPVQCALEYWVPMDHPQRNEMSCATTDKTGRSVFAEHPVFKRRFPDTNTKVWRDYALEKANELVFLGCSSFVQDVPAIMAITRNTRSVIGDGCHSREGEDQFQTFKKKRPDATYPDFMKQSVIEYHDWLHKAIRATAKAYDPNFDVYFSGNTSAASPAHLQEDSWFFPYFDYLQAEVFGDFSHNNPQRTIAELARLLDVKDSRQHPVVLAVRSDTTRSDNVDYLRKTIISAYSFGMVPMIPWTANGLTDDPVNYYFGNPASFSDVFRTVRAWGNLLDGFYPSEQSQIIPPGNTTNASHSLRVSSDDIVATSRDSAAGAVAKGVFVVNWGAAGRSAWIDLKKSDFNTKPGVLMSLGESTPIKVTPEDNGDYYRYSFPSLPEWAILY
jgi:hypothetical protein